MSNNILFIFEGERPEKQITDNLTKYFINENSVIQCAYCANIYRLYKDIEEDEDLDTFQLLKALPNNREILSSYKRDDFAEIYMFFDYDGHDTIADDGKVLELLNFFDEETFRGKLYISYPMVEALKHYSESIDFKLLKVEAKSNIKYKQIVGEEAKNELIHITKYTKEIWIFLIEIHLMKMNFIVNADFSLPIKRCTQVDIFENQLEKYINKTSDIAVLSSFPIW
jgi:hypothetical protein